MTERLILKPEETICLCGESDGTIFKRTFTIDHKISEGASAVCYEAYYDNSSRGVLKEFYPKEICTLERNHQGQLICPAERQTEYERFREAEKKYIEPHEMLQNVRQNSDNQDLATFIPAFEIYHGCEEAGNVTGTTYVWTPEPKLETFDRVCDEIHKAPYKNPEHKLVTVLTAIESLTKCICALHSAGMIHRDIKPSNFGFLKRGNETLTQTLSMCDINSICSVYGEDEGRVETVGYQEPEAGTEAANNQTDIYSIGATLFHAIIVPEKTKGDGFDYHYQQKYYNKLRQMVNESELIQVSEANSHPRLKNILTVILQKCLCERTYRYPNCEELLDDIETALYYALPSDIARRTRSGEKWELAEVLKSLETNRKRNSSLAIQYHLYEHPLYQSVLEEEELLNVLVIGCGNYGQKFLDSCLQAGQIRGKKLNVTVLSDNETDKEIYLGERPELAKFFNIDGALADREDIYGNITFKTTELKRGDQAENAGILQDIMGKYVGDEFADNGCVSVEFPHYIFVALGEDRLNLNAAKACKDAVDAYKPGCIVNYVCEESKAFEDKDSPNKNSGLYPLFVNADVKKSALYPEIERMAFNTHLAWEKNLNVDYKNIKADFRKNYNHYACVSNVLSLKYKLHSIGIDWEENDYHKAAEKFTKLISDSKNNQDIINELIWVEHRRWVTEKLCFGWQGIQDLEDCVGGVTKDAKNKRHVCILQSRPDQKLTMEYSKNNYEKWDKASKSDLGKLDELDRMSVELHRMFMKKARDVRKQNLLSGNSIAAIRTLIEGNKKAVVAFQEWLSCLKDLWNGDRESARLYKGLKASFLSAIDGLSNEKRKSVREQVKAFETIFYPVLASMEYRDWKKTDADIIAQIPFVLTYTENAYMVIPYAIGDNTEVFGNVAAPTVVSPERILYLYFVEKEQDKRNLQESIPYVMGYMKKKKLKSAVEFILICTDETAAFVNEDYEKEIRELGNGRIRQVKCMKLERIENIAADLGIYLAQRRSGKGFFAVEKNKTRLSAMLQVAGFYNTFSSYEFDSGSMKFTYSDLSGCDMLGCIKKMPYITVTDMAAFRLSSSESSNQPEFFADYEELWEKYHKSIFDSQTWKVLCGVLKKYANDHDVLASFQKQKEENKGEAKEYRYIAPIACKKSIDKILSLLKEKEILEKNSRVNGYMTDSCEVIIVDRCGYQKEYNTLFSNVYALMCFDAITLTPSSKVTVVFDNLVVSGASLAWIEKDKYKEAAKKLMDYFSQKGYVMNLTIASDGKMSFTYASRQIKELLTTEGKMLEVYTYHKVKELGDFDDVVSSFEINWEGENQEGRNEDVKNEFDCILTKGFRTLFVECKAQNKMDQNYYFKLAGLTKQFGINATAVLIADTQEQSYYDTVPINAMQRERGNMMTTSVVTIWKPEEIDNIGQTLLKIINGEYVSDEM